jgi:lysine 2,3-aminomutase
VTYHTGDMMSENRSVESMRLINSAEDLSRHFAVDREALQAVCNRYPMRISLHYLSLIKEVGDPIWRQCVPDPRELADDTLLPDPLNEEALSPVPRLIHRYPDRVVWLVSDTCAVYCRFCMRKRQVGCAGVQPRLDIQAVLAYLRAEPAIRDVVLSGGDPLLLADDQLAEILAGLRAIPHIEIIRIGTRVPVTLPDRITPALCALLKRFHPLYVNTHFNHPREICPASTKACALLSDAGIPLGNQTVLLSGVNDDAVVMKELVQRLLAVRVRPYYLHHPDLVRGTAHFRPRVACGLAIMASLRGHTSGMAVPYYVVDLPEGKGKVPLLPDNVTWHGTELRVRNYQGEQISYPDF